MKKVIELFLQSCMPKAPSISDERELRVQLAAAYRLSDQFQMSELIETDIPARLPGHEKPTVVSEKICTPPSCNG